MIDIYADVEASVLDLFKADDSLKEIKTFETGFRDALFSQEQLVKGFSSAELPAIAVSAEGEPVKSSPFSRGQIRYIVPVQVVILARGQVKAEVRRQLRGLQWTVEQLVSVARQNSILGINRLVMPESEVSATINLIPSAPLYFGIATVEFSVLQVVDL